MSPTVARPKRQRAGHRTHLQRTLSKTETLITKDILRSDETDEIKILIQTLELKMSKLEEYDEWILENCDIDQTYAEMDDIERYTAD